MKITKRITLATIKAFVRKAGKNLLIKCHSAFDGMTDCVESIKDDSFDVALLADVYHENNMGIQGAWFVLRSRDWLSAFDDGEYSGYYISNACGSFSLAVKK